jgi:hypothetical protein
VIRHLAVKRVKSGTTKAPAESKAESKAVSATADDTGVAAE